MFPALALALVFQGCTTKPVDEDSSIGISPASVSFKSAASTEVLSMEASGNWTASSSASWLTVSPDKGTKDVTSVTLSASENTDASAREATVVFKIDNSGASVTVDVSQEGASATPEPEPEPEPQPYSGSVKNADDFLEMIKNPGMKASIDADIDLRGVDFTPSDFAADIEGNNHTITYELSVPEGAAYNAGLFSSFTGTVKNLKVAGKLQSGVPYTGGFAGIAEYDSQIENVENSVVITVDTYGTAAFKLGGIVGLARTGVKISSCTNKGKIDNIMPGKDKARANQIGGIVGNAYAKVTLENCTNDAQLTYSGTGTSRIGGMVGYIDDMEEMLFDGCVNNGDIVVDVIAPSSGYQYVGGLTGYYGTNASSPVATATSTYRNCTNNGKVTVTGNAAGNTRSGGIAAYVSMTDSKANKVEGINYSFTFEKCTNNGSVSTDGTGANNHLGGIIGMAESVAGKVIVKDCVSNAPVSVAGSGYAGGILGLKGAPSSSFTGITVTKNVELTTGNAAALITAGNSAYTTAVTGKVGSVKVNVGGASAVVTADNYKDVLFTAALGEGGSTDGVTFGD